MLSEGVSNYKWVDEMILYLGRHFVLSMLHKMETEVLQYIVTYRTEQHPLNQSFALFQSFILSSNQLLFEEITSNLEITHSYVFYTLKSCLLVNTTYTHECTHTNMGIPILGTSLLYMCAPYTAA